MPARSNPAVAGSRARSGPPRARFEVPVRCPVPPPAGKPLREAQGAPYGRTIQDRDRMHQDGAIDPPGRLRGAGKPRSPYKTNPGADSDPEFHDHEISGRNRPHGHHGPIGSFGRGKGPGSESGAQGRPWAPVGSVAKFPKLAPARAQEGVRPVAVSQSCQHRRQVRRACRRCGSSRGRRCFVVLMLRSPFAIGLWQPSHLQGLRAGPSFLPSGPSSHRVRHTSPR